MSSAHHEAVLRHVRTLFSVGGAAGMSDGQLLERFSKDRDEAAELAFAALVERHGPMVLRVCRGILRDAHDAEDAFQATFLVLARRSGSIRRNDSVGSWLLGVARRVSYVSRASEARRRRHEAKRAEASTTLAWPDAQDDLPSILAEEVGRLPERQRAPMVLCYLEGRSCEDAARLLGLPIGTVKSRMARARDRLKSRLVRRGLAPSAALAATAALPPHAPGASVPSALVELTARAAIRFAARTPTIGTISGPVLNLAKGVLSQMILFKLKAAVVVAAAGLGMLAFSSLSNGRPASAAGPETPVVSPPKPVEDPRTTPNVDTARAETPNASLWKSVVRIKIQSEGAIGFGSGTIIDSREGESIILTCAHIFKLDGQRQVPPAQFPARITVDLFGGEVVPLGRGLDEPEGWLAQEMLGGGTPRGLVHPTESTAGEVIDYDFAHDVGLVRIRPGRILPASRITPKAWKSVPAKGIPMMTIGCSFGGDATFWGTTVRNPVVKGLAGNPEYEAIECSGAPAPGRSGGGLFSIGGYLVGVSNFAEPKSDLGIYASLNSIYHILERNGLSTLYQTSGKVPAPPRTVAASAGDEFEILVRLAAEQIEGGNRPKARETIARLERQVRARQESLKAALRELDANYSSRLEQLSQAAKDPVKPSPDPGAGQGIAIPRTDPTPAGPSSDQERRLERVEQTLEHVLKALEELKPARHP